MRRRRPDAAQLAADKQRVRDIHAIAALVEDYKKRSSRIPFDPDGDTGGVKVYSYSVYGPGYTVGAYLHHHVVFSERVMGDTIQYRVGSSESVSLPILEYAKFIAGTSAVPARKFSRQ